MERRRHHETFASALARPRFGGAHQRASDADGPVLLVDDEQRQLRDRRMMVHRVPQMDRRQSDDERRLLGDEDARVFVGGKSIEPARDGRRLGRIAKLRAEACQCLHRRRHGLRGS